MKKRLSQKISDIPSWMLYAIIAFYIIWDFTFSYLSIKNRPGVRESNPFHIFWINMIGIEYFLYMIPIAIILLFTAIKLGGRLIYKNNKNIKGENHLAIIMILIMSPNILNQFSHVLFQTNFTKWGFKIYYPLAIFIIVAYTLWIDYEIKKTNKQT